MTETQQADAEIGTRLFVTSGVQAGSSIVFGGEPAVIGGDADADIILFDDDIAAQHVRIEQVNDKLLIEALAPGVVVNHEQLAEGATCETYFPVLLDVGSASLRIDGPPPPPPAVIHEFNLAAKRAAPQVAKSWGTYAAVALMAFAGFGVLGYSFRPGIPSTKILDRVLPEQETTNISELNRSSALPPDPITPVPPPIQQKPIDANAAAAELRNSIAAEGLASVLSVSVESGQLAVKGTLAPDQQAGWQKVQKAFDQGSAGQLLLIDNVKVAAPTPAPRLGFEAVLFAEEPYVIVAGRRQKQGDVIDGWKIEAIERDRIVVSQGNQSVSLKY